MRPLFIIDVIPSSNEDEFVYSFPIKGLMSIILGDFDRVLKEL